MSGSDQKAPSSLYKRTGIQKTPESRQRTKKSSHTGTQRKSGDEPQQPNVRAIAAEILYKVCHEGQSLSHLLPDAQKKVAQVDKALLQELCFGSCRWYHRLHLVVKALLVRPLKGKETYGRQLLIIGLYQLLETRIPAHAAIHETVEASKVLEISWLSGVINGVLRNFQRELEIWRERIARDEALHNSHPAWLQEKLVHNWPEHYQLIIDGNNARPPLTLRVNAQHHTRDQYLELLAAQGMDARITPFAPMGITLNSAVDVTTLPGFDEGWVSVQDEAAQLCAGLMELKAGLNVLDACAAPGGKTCAMLEQQPNLKMIALDSDPERLKRVEENLQRLRLNAEVVCADAAIYAQEYQGPEFDRILLDAPCSATGVIRRHPDIKLLRKETDILPLAKIQITLLESLWPLLKSGGILVYATCSVFPQENNRIIERFLKQQPDAQADTLNTAWGALTSTGARQLFPEIEGHDGFFYARLRKA